MSAHQRQDERDWTGRGPPKHGGGQAVPGIRPRHFCQHSGHSLGIFAGDSLSGEGIDSSTMGYLGVFCVPGSWEAGRSCTTSHHDSACWGGCPLQPDVRYSSPGAAGQRRQRGRTDAPPTLPPAGRPARRRRDT
eukprot:gene17173-biopygen11362